VRDFQDLISVLYNLNSGIDLLVGCGHQCLNYPLQVLLTRADDRILLRCSRSIDSQADAINDDQVDSLSETLLLRHLSDVTLHEVYDAENVSNRQRFALECLELGRLRLAE